MDTFSALLTICAGNSPVTGEFPAQRPVTQSFDFFFICTWINGWVNNGEACDLRRHRAPYNVTVMDIVCGWLVSSLVWFTCLKRCLEISNLPCVFWISCIVWFCVKKAMWISEEPTSPLLILPIATSCAPRALRESVSGTKSWISSYMCLWVMIMILMGIYNAQTYPA